MHNLYDWLVANHTMLESVAALATAFALLVPLPAFVITRLIAKREERLNRTYQYLESSLAADTATAQALGRQMFVSIDGDPKLFLRLEADERATLIRALNANEHLAFSVRRRMLDETLIKQWLRNTLLSDWRRCETLILHLRKSSPGAFLEWEWLARRWSKD